MKTSTGPTRHRTARPAFAVHPLSLAVLLALAAPAGAVPTGATVVAGQVSVRNPSAALQVVTQSSDKAIVDWKSYSIGASETVRINQPAATAVLLNRVTGYDPSAILGQLQANGRVFLINPYGVVFGAGARVDVGGLVASSLSLANSDFLAGRFDLTSGDASGPAQRGAVRNEGRISAPGGTVVLAAPVVSNTGTIEADGGRIGLAAANSVLVDVEGDGLIFFRTEATQASNRLEQLGRVQADAGSIELRAAARAGLADTVLNLSGIAQARSLGQRNGQVVIDGGDSGVTRVAGSVDATGAAAGEQGGHIAVLGHNVLLDAGAVLDASGASGGGTVLVGGNFQGKGPERNAFRTFVDIAASVRADALTSGAGGQVVVWADDITRFNGSLSARGGAQAGDGGNVEVSGARLLDFNGTVDTAAPAGRVGRLLLDPLNITIDASGANGNLVGGGGSTDGNANIYAFSEDPAATSNVRPATLTGLGTSVTLQAKNDITFAAGANGTVALTTAGAGFSAQAGGNIAFGAGATLTTNGGAIVLRANDTSVGSVPTGAGSITGGAAITSKGTGAGAGGNITLSTGAGTGTITVGALDSSGGSLAANAGGNGGNVSITTVNGNVTTGTITTSGGAAGASATPLAGGNAGSVTLQIGGITTTTTVAAISATGGAGVAAGNGGNGGAVSVTSAAGALSAGAITTTGGASTGTAGSAATIGLSAGTNLTLTGALNAGADTINLSFGQAGGAGNTLDLTNAAAVLTAGAVNAAGGTGTSDAIAVSNDVDFTLTDALLTRGGGLPAIALLGIEVANLTGGAGGNTFTVSGWSGTGTLTGGGGADVLAATNDVDFTLTDTSLARSGLGTLTLSAIGTANLTGGAGANTFTVSGWSGIGTLTGGGGADVLAATNDVATITLTDTSLDRTGLGTLTLASIGTAHLTGGAGDNTIDVSAYTGTVDITASAGTADVVTGRAASVANITLTGTSTGSAYAITGANAGTVTEGANVTTFTNVGHLVGGSGNDTFTLGAGVTSFIGSIDGGAGSNSLAATDGTNTWALSTTANAGSLNGTTTFSNIGTLTGGAGADTLSASNDVDFTLTDTSLARTGLGTLTLSGFEVANLTGGGSANTFTVSGWSGTGTLTGGGGADVVAATNDVATFALTDTSLARTGLGTLTLANIGTANLTGGAGANAFTVSGWSGTGTLTGGGGADVVAATNDVDFTLTDTSLARTGLGTLTLSAIGTANLTGGAGANTFTVSGWSGTGTLTGGGGADVLAATNDVDFTLTDTSLARSGLGTLTLAAIGTANLTGGAGANAFTVSGWSGTGTLTGGGGADVVAATNDVATFTLTDTSLARSGLGTLTLASIGTANLTGGAGANTFTVSGWSGDGTLTGGGGADVVAATNDVNFTLTDTSLARSGLGTLTLANIGTANLTGGASANTFTVSGWTGTGSLTGGGGSDTLVVADDVATITLTDASLGRTGRGTLTLSAIGNANLTGGPGNNAIDAIGFTGNIAIQATADAGGAGDTIIGNGANTTLTGTSTGSAFLITGQRSGTLTEGANVTHFNSGVGNLVGGAGNDTFTLGAGVATFNGSLNGGGGTNTLAVTDGTNTFQVDATGAAGTLNAGTPVGTSTVFSNMSTLTALGGISNTLEVTSDTDFTLTNTTLARTSLPTITFSGINIVNLTGGSSANTFNVSGWTGTGKSATLTGGGGADVVVASNDVNFTLTDSKLGRSGMSDVTLSGIGSATLTGGASSNTFDVSGWTGTGTLTGGGGADTLTATNDVNFTLTDTSLARSGLGTLTLAAIGTANLTGGASANSFIVTGWTGSGALAGAGGADTFIVTSGTTTFNGSVDGGAGSNTLSATGGSNQWAVTAAGAGTLNASTTFTNIGTLSGGAGSDTLTGLAAGDDYTVTAAKALTLTNAAMNATSIDVLVGGAGTNRLIGLASGDTYTITAAKAVTLTTGALSATSIDALVGGAGNDSYTLAAGVLTFNGPINGGGGSNSLAATDGSNAWAVTGANAGTLNTTTAFSNIGTLTGGSGADSFVGAPASTLSGTLNDGGGATSLSGTLHTAGTQTYSGAVTLAGATTLTSTGSGAAGDIAFNSTVGGAQALAVNTAGATTFGAAVTGLTTLTTDATGTVSLRNVTTSGAIALGEDATLNGTYTTTNAAFTVAGATTLAGDSTVSTGTGAVGFTGTVNATTAGQQALTVNTTGAATFAAALGNTAALKSLTTNSGGTVSLKNVTTTGAISLGEDATLAGTYTTANAAFNAAGTTTLAGDTTVSTGSGAAGFTGTVNATTAGQQALTVNSSGVTTFSAALGGSTALKSLSTDAAGSTSLRSVTAAGDITIADNATLNAATTLTSTGSGAIAFGGTVGGAQALAVNTAGATTFGAAVTGVTSLTTDAGGTVSLKNVTTTGAITLGDAATLDGTYTTTNAAFTVAGATTLAGDTTVSTGSGAVGFTGTVNATTAGQQALTVNSSGVTTFSAALGGSTALKRLSTDAAGSTSLRSVTAAGDIALADNATLNGDTTLTSTGGGAIAFGGTVDGAQALAVNTAGATTFGAAVGGITPLTSLTTDAGGTVSLKSVTTTGAIALGDDATLNGTYTTTNAAFTVAGPTTLAGDTTVTTGSGAVTFTGTVNATTAGQQALTVNSSGVTTFSAALGGGTALKSLSTDAAGSTSLRSVTATGDITLADNATLNAATTLTSTGGGAIAFGGTVDGAQALAVNTAGATTFGGAVGAITPLASLSTDTGGTVSLNNVTTTGAIALGDDATLSGSYTTSNAAFTVAGATTLAGDTTVATGSGAVGFAGIVNATTAGQQALTVNSSGLTTFSAALGGSTALKSLATDAAGSTSLRSVTAAGDITLADNATLNGATTLTSTGVGAITFGGTVDGAQALAVNTAGATTFGAAVGATTPLASLTTDAGGSTRVGGSVTSTGDQHYGDAVVLTHNATFTGDTVSFGSSLAAGSFDFDVLANSAQFLGPVTSGGTFVLAPPSSTSTIGVAGGSGAFQIDQTQLDLFAGVANLVLGRADGTGAIRLGNLLLPTNTLVRSATGTVDFTGSVDSALGTTRDLTVTSGGLTTFSGNVGSTTALGNLTVTNATRLDTAALTVTGAQSYGTAVGLGRDATLSAASVAMGSTLTLADHDLTVLADTITIAGPATGTGTARLAPHDATGSIGIAGGAGLLQVSQAQIDRFAGTATLALGRTDGTGDLTVGALTLPTRVQLQSGSGNVDVTAAVDSSAGAAGRLDVATGGLTTLRGTIGATGALGTLDVAGASTLAGGLARTTGAQTYGGAVALATDTTLTGSTVTLAGTVDGAQALTVNAATTTFGAALGGTTALTSLTTDAAGTTRIGGNITTSGAQTYNDALQLTADATLAGTALTLAKTIDGAQALTLAGSTGTTLGGAIGGTTALTSLAVQGGVVQLNSPTVTTTGAQRYAGALTLGGDAALSASAVDFGAGVDGAHALSLQSAGPTSFAGDIGAVTALTSLTASGGGSVQLQGAGITTSGAQNFSGSLLLAGNTQLRASSLTFGGGIAGATDLGLQTDALSLTGAITSAVPGSGTLTIAPITPSLSIGLAGGSGSLQITQALLDGSGGFATHHLGRTDGSGAVNANALVLHANTVIDAGSADIRLNGSVDGAFDLALHSGATTRIAGPVGTTTALRSLATDNAAAADWNGSSGERTLFDLADGSGAARVVTTGAQTYADPLIASVPLNLAGGAIAATLPANRFDGAVSAQADSLQLRSEAAITLANVSLANGGSVETDGLLQLSGALQLGGGTLVLTTNATPTAGDFADTELRERHPSLGLVALKESSATLFQSAGSTLSSSAGSLLVLRSPHGGSMALEQAGNALLGTVSAVSGTLGDSDATRFRNSNIVLDSIRLSSSEIHVAGAPPTNGDQTVQQAGIEADLVKLSADTLTTGPTGQIRARLPFDNTQGAATSAPALTLVLSPKALAEGNLFGSAAPDTWVQVRIGNDLGGFLTVRPKGAGGDNAFVLLGGAPTPTPFYDGNGKLTEVRVFYNGDSPRTAQESGALTAVTAVVEEARHARFEEAVRTENVSSRLRSGVIAEVGAGRPATVGRESIRPPQGCNVKAGTLQCD